MSEFITYEKFATIPELKVFVDFLQANNIPYELEDDVEIFDVSFANNRLHRDYRIKLQPEDFEWVTELRNKIAASELDEIDRSYYLFDFTNEELIDLISKQDEWSPFDFQLAQKILKERGKEINAAEIERLKNRRIKELAEPEKDDITWIVIGYIFAFLIGFIGIITGWYIMSNKKTLPNGERVYTFSQTNRSHGGVILIIGILVTLLTIGLKIFGYLLS